MLKKVLEKSAHPRRLLRSILAVDDSPHAVALGVAVGVFIGLTPTVGVQTILVLVLVMVTRRVCYFNAPAAMASTYISNPLTMLPMYYFWYRLGLRFFPSDSGPVSLEPLMHFDGFSGWWTAMCELGVQVGVPMFAGALATAPIGAVLAYFALLGTLNSVKRVGLSKAVDSSATAENTPASKSGSKTHGPHSAPQVATRKPEDHVSKALTQ